jgi:hypothetical protein
VSKASFTRGPVPRYCDGSRRSPLGEQVLRFDLRAGVEGFLQRDNLCSDVRRRVLGLESGVGIKSGLHGRIGADKRPENPGALARVSIRPMIAVPII